MHRTPPRVLLLTTSFPLHDGSVSGLFVARLAKALAPHVALRVLTPADAAQRPAATAAAPEVRTFRYAPRRLQRLAHGAGGIPAALAARRARLLLVPGFLAAMFLACFRAARDVDLIHANWSVCGVIAGLVGRLRGLPVVVTLRGQDANRAGDAPGFALMLNLCARLCDRIVTVSEAMAGDLRQLAPTAGAKLLCIPNGVGDEFVAIPVPNAAGDAIRLLCIASLIPGKDIATLLRALAQLPPRYTLTVVGEGEQAQRLHALADALGLGARVHWSAFRPAREIPPLFAQADVFVLPSLAEGRPNVVLEALAAARPVVASDIDGVRELIGADERGLLHPPGDADALAACLLRLADFELRVAMGARGRQYILDRGLTWENAARRYAATFDRILAERQDR